jgi:nucleotide-binding universal stress UspA family protein
LVADATHLRVVHVLPMLEVSAPGVIWEAIDDASRQTHADQALADRLGSLGLANAKRIVLFGDPGREVADYAQKSAADLIVLPSHGRTGLSRLLMGSTAERIVRMAHCPVLVLRT